MTSSAKSVYYFGFYLYVTGLTLIFIPNVFLSTLQLPETNEIWIRVVGVLVFCIGFYYHRTGATGNTAFLKLTIPTRLLVFVTFTSFVALQMVPPIIIGVGAIDLAGAVWTWRSLKNEHQL